MTETMTETMNQTVNQANQSKTNQNQEDYAVSKFQMQKRLEKYAKICKRELEVIGIKFSTHVEFEINTRAKKRFGQCSQNGIHYTISITDRLLKGELNESGLKNTIIHELLHTCQGCMNHGTEWQRLCNKVNREYGYNIKRTSTNAEKHLEISEYKYIYKCSCCGLEVGYYRQPKWARNLSAAYHSSCGKKSHMDLITNN